MEGHRDALLDWMACAVGGSGERAARAARGAGDGLLERVAWLGTAGHVLDFDDTYLPGIAHLSAPTAPAAIAVGAERRASVGDVLEAYAAGFEAMGTLSRASHPALYDGGWHPTAVCGSVGAAVAAGRLLELPDDAARSARALALLRAGGLRAAFGSDGKALQVGMAAAAGVHAALAARSGARVSAGEPFGFAGVFGGEPGEAGPSDPALTRNPAEADPSDPAIAHNWVKPWPCCLLAHSAIEAGLSLDGLPDGPLEVVVHPVARAAARYDGVADGLQAKFSIPYLVAYAGLRGEPRPESFAAVDPAVSAAAQRVAVRADPALAEAEARLTAGGETLAHVRAARGSPERPLDAGQLAAKVHSLAGERLDGLLDDPARPAAELLAALAQP